MDLIYKRVIVEVSLGDQVPDLSLPVRGGASRGL